MTAQNFPTRRFKKPKIKVSVDSNMLGAGADPK